MSEASPVTFRGGVHGASTVTTISGATGMTMTSRLFQEYEVWCSDSGVEPLDKTMFGKGLGNKGLERHKGRKGNGWRGVVLKDSDSEFRATDRPDDRYSTLN